MAHIDFHKYAAGPQWLRDTHWRAACTNLRAALTYESCKNLLGIDDSHMRAAALRAGQHLLWSGRLLWDLAERCDSWPVWVQLVQGYCDQMVADDIWAEAEFDDEPTAEIVALWVDIGGEEG